MKIIYIAGKYTDDSYSKITDNIKQAEIIATQLWAKGWAVICPHTNSGHFEIYESMLNINYHTWLNGYLEILSRCDAIFMLPNYKESAGAKKELLLAMEKNILIYYNLSDVETWRS